MRKTHQRSSSGLRHQNDDAFNEDSRLRGSRTIDPAIIFATAGFIVFACAIWAGWRLTKTLTELGEFLAQQSEVDPDPGNPHEDTRANKHEKEDADPR